MKRRPLRRGGDLNRSSKLFTTPSGRVDFEAPVGSHDRDRRRAADPKVFETPRCFEMVLMVTITNRSDAPLIDSSRLVPVKRGGVDFGHNAQIGHLPTQSALGPPYFKRVIHRRGEIAG
jgi:hypothetical protein